ncbi:MAG: hypothetical protein K8R21_14410, partial [Leptospira sp.]|nr:hypothetical protein [Leptospira sp.]
EARRPASPPYASLTQNSPVIARLRQGDGNLKDKNIYRRGAKLCTGPVDVFAENTDTFDGLNAPFLIRN